MGEGVLKLLNQLFTVVGKAKNESLAVVTEEEAVSEQKITKKGTTVTRESKITAGAIHSIDEHF